MGLIYNIDFDIIGIVILLILLVVLKTKFNVPSKSSKLFRHFIYFALISGIFDIITAYTISYASVIPHWLNYLTNSIYLVMTSIAAMTVGFYVRTLIKIETKIHDIIDFTILGFQIIILIVNIFTGLVFKFDDTGYVHGPLFMLNYIIPMLFLIHDSEVLIQYHKLFTKEQLYSNISVVLFPLIACIFQIIYPTVLLTFVSYVIFSLIIQFSLETPDFIELEYLRKNLENEVEKQTQKLKERQRRIQVMSLETTRALAQAIDEKDEYTNGHSLRVSSYSVLIAQSLGWDLDKIEDLRLSALLHDIGKIGIPDAILKKPNKLNKDEFKIIKTHTDKGGKILHSLTSLPNAEVVAMYHHERFDGLGYPGTYAGKDIPELARIVSIADSFDAMMSKRCYRDELPLEEALRQLKEGRGTQFDPDFLDLFVKIVEAGVL